MKSIRYNLRLTLAKNITMSASEPPITYRNVPFSSNKQVRAHPDDQPYLEELIRVTQQVLADDTSPFQGEVYDIFRRVIAPWLEGKVGTVGRHYSLDELPKRDMAEEALEEVLLRSKDTPYASWPEFNNAFHTQFKQRLAAEKRSTGSFREGENTDHASPRTGPDPVLDALTLQEERGPRRFAGHDIEKRTEEVLNLLGKGYDPKEIAGQLGLSTGVVRSEIGRLRAMHDNARNPPSKRRADNRRGFLKELKEEVKRLGKLPPEVQTREVWGLPVKLGGLREKMLELWVTESTWGGAVRPGDLAATLGAETAGVEREQALIRYAYETRGDPLAKVGREIAAGLPELARKEPSHFR